MFRIALIVLVACNAGDKALGQYCRVSDDCATGFCVRNICESGQLGAKCGHTGECDKGSGLLCFANRCRLPGHDGEGCVYDGDCQPELRCGDEHCLPPDKAALANAAAPARKEAERKKVAAEKEAKLLAESGVVADHAAVVEQATSLPGPGSRVRVVTTSADRTAFAACRTDERLVGGGCRSERDVREVRASYPSGHGADDTVGARWNCAVGPGNVTAYALCAKLP